MKKFIIYCTLAIPVSIGLIFIIGFLIPDINNIGIIVFICGILASFVGWLFKKFVPRKNINQGQAALKELESKFVGELDTCIKTGEHAGIYDDYISRTFKIEPNETGKYFKIKSTWDFKIVSALGKPPKFRFNHSSKFPEFQKYFKLLTYEINGDCHLSRAEQLLQFKTEKERHYILFNDTLEVSGAYTTFEVKCEYEFFATLPEYNSYSTYMYPAKNRSFEVLLEGDDAKNWIIRANIFTAFKNLGYNINAVRRDTTNFVEDKTSKVRYKLEATNWTLPGTGIAFTIHKIEHDNCKWLPDIRHISSE